MAGGTSSPHIREINAKEEESDRVPGLEIGYTLPKKSTGQGGPEKTWNFSAEKNCYLSVPDDRQR